MPIEVELKFRVTDVEALAQRLTAFGATAGETVHQVDAYFAHPCRDFAKTDEAFRIRTVGDMSHFTYKGPRLDSVTKTRQELEVPLSMHDPGAKQMRQLIIALGFKPVTEVIKRRRCFALVQGAWRVQVCIDFVEELGHFVEIEIVAEEPQVVSARMAIANVARELELRDSERRSYLELLLEHREKKS
jgi:adenylate cyclase, class 2